MAEPANRIQPYSTGSVAIWVAGGDLVNPVALGYAEQYPKETHQPAYQMLMNDVSGRNNPLDVSFQGMTAQVSIVLTDWDDGVYQVLQTFPRFLTTRNPGSWAFSDVGTLMGTEEVTLEIWLQYLFPSIPKPVYSTLPNGYHYLQCVPWAPMEWETGAAPMKRHIQFFAWPVANFSEGIFELFDSSMAALPNIGIADGLAV